MLDAESALFCQIGDQSNDVYFIFDVAANQFKYLNSAFETIWEMPIAAVMNNPQVFADTIHPEDRQMVEKYYTNFTKNLSASKFTFRVVTATQLHKHITVNIYPIKNTLNVILLAGIAEDITVQKTNILYMEKINARKNSTLEILAHELKGPLGMISTIASGIQRDIDQPGKNRILQSVQFIQDMCRRNIALIRDLVNQEFLESAEVDLRRERSDLVSDINNVIQQYKSSEYNLAKTFIINSSDEKIFVYIDSLKFMQVINNLISNAIKFTPDNGVIEVDIKDMGSTLVTTIKDNGIGIPEDVQPYLFDRFTRARRTGLRGEEPVGLGMSVIKTIVELHRGTISFISKENEGSSFYIEIPKS